jgi:hypothetical protein
MSFLNLAAVDAENFQTANPPGITRAFAVIGRGIEGSWPNLSVINEYGELIALPSFLQDAKFVEYLFPKGTCWVDSEDSGDPSYQNYKHVLNISLAGFTTEVRQEATKHINAGTVWIVQQKGGEYVVAGSSDEPLFLNSMYKSGKGGKDKKGYEMKGEVEGMQFDLPVVPVSLVSQIDFISVLDTDFVGFSNAFSSDFAS